MIVSVFPVGIKFQMLTQEKATQTLQAHHSCVPVYNQQRQRTGKRSSYVIRIARQYRARNALKFILRKVTKHIWSTGLTQV
jgi:hypothetical protein